MKKYLKNFSRYRYLLMELVKKGITLKYRRSYLGLVWTLLEPLLTMIVLTFVFGTMFGNNDKFFPVYVLCGRLLYSCFSSCTKIAMRSIRANQAMIKKVYVPKYLYPFSSVIYNYSLFLFSLIVLAVVSVVLGINFTFHIFELILPLIQLFVLSIGVSLILSTVCVFFRDLEYLWDVVLMLIMYCSAIFYNIEKVGVVVKGVIKFNPLYCIISNFRCALIDGKSIFTTQTYGISNGKMFAYTSVVCVVVLVLGVYVFKKHQDKFILHI